MEQNMERQQLVQEYKQAVVPLLRYLPWLEANRGKPGNTYYEGPESTEHSMKFPVYDSTLLSFVREASRSSLMDRNYSYIYTRNRIKTHEDERRIIGKAELKDWELLRGILSKYVLGGYTKGTLWSQGVQENIFCMVLGRMQKIIEHWDKAFDAR
ncbi:MAG: hypothetical protein K2G28_02845 [Acetatifactor sp.]|nr:hypothetical protein [Acetatifactor sp.]